MEILDNINRLLGDDLKQVIQPGSKLRIAASCFSIYAFEALKDELAKIDSLQFIFTSPTFVPGEATDRLKKEHREFHIPKLERERSLYGSEFEVRLRNELTQRAIAKECAEWMRQKAIFRSNRGLAPMQQFATVATDGKESVYLPLHGFTAVDLGYEKGNAVSNFVHRIAAILRGINAAVFSQFKTNPEDFLLKAGTIINEQKATIIVEHLAYNPLDETHTIDIFTQEKKEDLSKGFKATRHIYDYVFTDSGNERTFVGELDASAEVVVYAKLPRSFHIPTPVGNYNPDWAIAFQSGKVKHVFFVAETKGSMSSMDLRKIEDAKIECARKFFAKITSDQVKYDVVNSYGKLMELVK